MAQDSLGTILSSEYSVSALFDVHPNNLKLGSTICQGKRPCIGLTVSHKPTGGDT